jgi:hypothetical protein
VEERFLELISVGCCSGRRRRATAAASEGEQTGRQGREEGDARRTHAERSCCGVWKCRGETLGVCGSVGKWERKQAGQVGGRGSKLGGGSRLVGRRVGCGRTHGSGCFCFGAPCPMPPWQGRIWARGALGISFRASVRYCAGYHECGRAIGLVILACSVCRVAVVDWWVCAGQGNLLAASSCCSTGDFPPSAVGEFTASSQKNKVWISFV